MQVWIAAGSDEDQKMKRHIHRNFQLPDDHDMEPEHAERLLMEFAYHYVTALLKYASDNLKKGTSVRVAEP